MNRLLTYLGFEPMTLKEMLLTFLVETSAMALFVYYILFIY